MFNIKLVYSTITTKKPSRLNILYLKSKHTVIGLVEKIQNELVFVLQSVICQLKYMQITKQ